MQHIYEKLDITLDNGLKIFDGLKDIKEFPQRLNRALKEIQPTSIFIFNSKPMILFFDKEVDRVKVFKQCWNFSEAPIIIINNEDNLTFEIYNGFNYIKNNKALEKLTDDSNELSYITLISGKYFQNSKNTFDSKNKVDKILLKNIKNARELLLANGLEDNKNIANSLIGRIIFIRYLIDRKVKLKFNSKKPQVLTNDELKILLNTKEDTYKLFDYLKSKENFNGDWFPVSRDELDLVDEKHLRILYDLISGTDIKSRQASLFDIYDFSIIPIEFISNVYESFIGEENQSKNGAYYTPTFLVDYILKYTVDDYFKKYPTQYNCKVLDPACGSGIFLVETLRKLVSQFETIKNRKIQPKEIIQLVKDNIYGIDKDKDAVQISIFSLYLTMLDYQTPRDIEKFHFPYLLDSKDNPDTPNFFQNDFFDLSAEYNDILKERKINFIIGNPPYGKGTIQEKSLAEEYIKIENIQVGNRDIVQPFMMRVQSFMSNSTQIAFVITSKVFYNFQSQNFRIKHLLNNFKINHILELSAVRKEVFENANVPVSIIFYEKYKTNKMNNTIKYISIKPNHFFSKLKILFIAKSDFKKVLQSKLEENDYLWKILVYGSYLDFNLIKRLKSYEKVSDKIISKEGMMIGGGDKNQTKEYDGMPYIQTKQIIPFCIKENNINWIEQDVHRNRTIDIFQAPSLLVSKGVSIDLNIKSGIISYDAVFTNSISSVKASNLNILYSVMSLLHSDFFKYYMLETASSVAVEREQSLNIEKFNIPYIENKNIVTIAKKIEEMLEKNLFINEVELDNLKKQLNINIFKAFNLTEEEYCLVDYATDIIIPWVMQKNYNKVFKQLDYKKDKKVLLEYINIFTKHYSNIYEQNNMYFYAEVLWDEYAICINFKILKTKPTDKIIWKKDKDIQKFLDLAGHRAMDKLYIQKDIKGFESDGFYIIKPNEYKNWHKAIGYLDFYEIDDAILRAGK